MKINDVNFLKAKSDKNLSAMVVIQRHENNVLRTYVRLCVEQKVKYKDEKETVFIEVDTEIKIENYSHYSRESKQEVRTICFHCSAYRFAADSIKTFLSKIKKDSDVSFTVVAYNDNENLRAANFVCHQLYGVIGNDCYLLQSYVGPQDLGNPINGRGSF